jgi:hypothetical protein
MNLVCYPVGHGMKAGDLCPGCKKGHLKATDGECNWVETDAVAGLEQMFGKEE